MFTALLLVIVGVPAALLSIEPTVNTLVVLLYVKSESPPNAPALLNWTSVLDPPGVPPPPPPLTVAHVTTPLPFVCNT